jgi:hypothetical protein
VASPAGALASPPGWETSARPWGGATAHAIQVTTLTARLASRRKNPAGFLSGAVVADSCPRDRSSPVDLGISKLRLIGIPCPEMRRW